MIRFKVACPDLVGQENRRPRTGGRNELPTNMVGTWLFHGATAAEACCASLRRLGYSPRMIALSKHNGLPPVRKGAL
jgi:hypothetical protein